VKKFSTNSISDLPGQRSQLLDGAESNQLEIVYRRALIYSGHGGLKDCLTWKAPKAVAILKYR